MCGLYFALHSGVEHQNLRPDQIKLFEPPGSPAYLLYTEDTSKNNPEEILCAAYAQKLGFLVMKLIVC